MFIFGLQSCVSSGIYLVTPQPLLGPRAPHS